MARAEWWHDGVIATAASRRLCRPANLLAAGGRSPSDRTRRAKRPRRFVRTRTLSLGHFRRYWYLRTCGNHIGFVYSFQDFGRSKRSLSPESVGTWPWRRSNGMNQVLVLAPIFDDWESATRLLGDLDRVAATIGSVEVVLVDD